jgi:hypothetical protein
MLSHHRSLIIVLDAEKNARSIRQNEAYVSRVLDPSRFGLKPSAPQQTGQSSMHDPEATTQTTDSEKVRKDASPTGKSKLLKKYFSSSVSPTQQFAAVSPRTDTEDMLDEKVEDTLREIVNDSKDATQEARASDDDGEDAVASSPAKLTMITDVLQGRDSLHDKTNRVQ